MTASSPAPAPAARYRVLFHIRQVGVGGIETALLGWLRTLDRAQFAVDVSVAVPTRELDAFARQIPQDVTVHTLLAPGRLVALHQRRRDHRLKAAGRVLLGLGMALRGRARIAQAMRQLTGQYDLVVDFDLTLRKLVAQLPAPVLGVRHFAFWDKRTAKARRVGQDLARYAGVAVLNPAMQDQLHALYGHSMAQVFELPNAFDLAGMRRLADEGGPPDVGGDYVVCVARQDMHTKGLDVLMHAWARLMAERPGLSCQLVLVGDGPDRATLQALCAQLDITACVTFAGVQRNPFRWMRGARALVLASRHEGAPNVLVEAMAIGCMVVSSDCRVGPRELLQGGRAGLLVPVDDVAGLAHALWRALTDDALRAACVQAGRVRAEDFGMAAGNARFLAITQTLVGSVRADGVSR